MSAFHYFAPNMILNKLVLLFTVSTVILSDRIQADFNCNVQPNSRLKKSCCRLPNPNTQNFPECDKYLQQSNKHTLACGTSCAFNSTGALDRDNKLNVTNLRAVLMRIFDVNIIYLDTVFIPAFLECELEMKNSNRFRKIPQRMDSGTSCSTVPLMYIMCAGDKIFLNCPSTLWSSSEECETLKDYIVNCGKHFSGRAKLFVGRGLNRSTVQFF